MEQGRWGYHSPEFSASGAAQHASGRARKTRSVSESLRSRREARSDQGEVWADIAAKAQRMGVYSPTLAMADLYEGHHTRVEDYVRALPPVTGQRGALFAIDGVPVGLDLFDSHDTLAALLPKLVRSYALDAIETAGAECQVAPSEPAERFLAELRAAEGAVFPAVGLGEDLRLTGPTLSGAALVLDGTLVHLCAFGNQQAPAETGGGSHLVRASRRRGLRL